MDFKERKIDFEEASSTRFAISPGAYSR